LEDKRHGQHKFFLDFYRKLDRFIGEVYASIRDDIPFIIVSDHGFTSIKKEIYLNSWLREKGYLKFTKDKPESFNDMHEESRVFALDPNRLYIHSKGKYQKGSVDAGEYNNLRQEMKDALMSLTLDDHKVIQSVFFKEELYSGPLLDRAPDLVALSHEGYDLKGAINRQEVSGTGFLTGGHTRENAVFYINRKIDTKDINIIDVGPTVMSLMNINTDVFDGRSLV
jgi:predicted AlkP superfamily phosphohydrolase/phosphomutase